MKTDYSNNNVVRISTSYSISATLNQLKRRKAKMKLRGLMISLLAVGLLTLNPSFAAAEKFAALYVGGAFTTNEDIDISASGGKDTAKADFDNSFTVGYRMGYWFEPLPWLGLALDVSYFAPDYDNGDLDIIPLTGLVMFRLPLMKSKDYPKGQLLPYVGVGPGAFFSKIKYDVANSAVPALLKKPPFSGNYSDWTLDIGLDVRAGLSRMFGHNRAVFLEYRFTKFSPDFKDNVLGQTVRTETDLNTHNVLIGFSYNF